MKQANTTTISLIAVILLAAVVFTASAEDAPSMWMVQDGDTMDIMVNTSDTSCGANAHVYFNPECINITDVDFTGSPWQPMEGRGWSHQNNNIRMTLTNFSGVPPGEYRVAKLTGEWLCEDGLSTINITNAEPVGVVAYNTTFTRSVEAVTTISIADGRRNVVLPIMISDAENVGVVDITLSYNPAIVKVTNVTPGAMNVTITNLEHIDEGWIRIGAYQTTIPGLSGEFALASISFEPVGTGTSPLTLNVTTFKDATPASTSIPYVISNGTYTKPHNGDADGNDEIDLYDALYIAKHVIGIPGFESIDEDAADVNGDGIIDLADAMYMAMHVIGTPGFDELR